MRILLPPRQYLLYVIGNPLSRQVFPPPQRRNQRHCRPVLCWQSLALQPLPLGAALNCCFDDVLPTAMIFSSDNAYAQRLKQHSRIWLTGYMGAGKSTVGKHLAKHLGWAFMDTDRELMRRYNKTMSQIFADHGEEAFRIAELDLLKEYAARPNWVVSTGGGTLVRQEPLDVALKNGLVVYLKAPVELLFERVIFSPKDRPMIDVPNAEQVFADRFKQREPFYLQSHLSVPTGQGKPQQVVAAIMEALVSAPLDSAPSSAEG